MKIIAPMLVLYSLLCLTAPDGSAVWLDAHQIVSLLRSHDDCAAGAKTKVTLSNGTIACVQETQKEVLTKLGQ